MSNIRTHYDILNVTRNAPPEVIRAAYKTLAQQFHPDRNPNNIESAQIMATINASYEILSDATRRKEYDYWILQEELALNKNNSKDNAPNQAKQERQAQSQASEKLNAATIFSHILENLRVYLGITVAIYAFIYWMFFDKKHSSTPYNAYPISQQTKYSRPMTAPNGQAWPTFSNYVYGYNILNTNGLSTLTVDNSKNDSDVFVKLVSLDGAQAYPVRQFYITAFGSFTLKSITSGSYDIRYRDLSSGGLSRSDAFNLEEIQTYDGIRYSNITMTLYKVRHGNMNTHGLSENEF